jgi:predicted ATPase/DNA-binding winged helix-turn-helix (wHTH) protein
MDGHAISFGPFRLLAAQRLLLEGDNPVRLGSRAFDILAVLVERHGEVVGKKELIARVWPKTFVEDANLKIQVSALRRALGDGQGGHRYVVTVPGRGYNFVAPVSLGELPQASRGATPAVHNLPAAATRMIGREHAVAELVLRLSRQRLVTITGPGGIGKTTVALAVAERMIASFEHGVWLVDLAPLSDPGLVSSAVATVLGLDIRAEDSLPGLVAALKSRRTLLLLDNCEHVVEAVASMATAILNGAPGVNIMATSREPLGVAGESGYRLGPLGSPQPSGLTAAEAEVFPAVQLFVERASAVVEDFALTDDNAPLVAEICRRLDGLPLAIEFAAPRVEVLGVEGLAVHLDHSFTLLRARGRAGSPRHQTMRAVVDWSYGLLSWDDQLLFRALGIFSGGFSVEAVGAMAGNSTAAGVDAIDRLADLVAKSLVVADVSGTKPRFRLLDTTRAYAIEKLDESGERGQIARRHAEYYRDLFERSEGEELARPASEWLADYAREINNLRAALDGAYASHHGAEIGVALTVAALPLWLRLSLHNECRSRAKQALATLGTEGSQDPREEMKLHIALGTSTGEAPEMRAAFSRALEIAESLGETEYQLRALEGLYFFHAASSQHRDALPFAQNFRDLAAIGSDREAQLFGEHLVGLAKHFLDDQVSARRHLEQVVTHRATADQGRDVIRFQIDVHASTLAFLARVLWLQGYSDQAVRTAETSIAEARATGHALSLCYSLALAACPIALWVGDLASAAHYAGMLLDESAKHGLPLWSEYGARFKRAVMLRGGGPVTGSRLLQAGPDEIAEPYIGFQPFAGMTELAEALAQAGRAAEGFALLEAGIKQSEAGWVAPELLRLKGEFFLLQGTPAARATAEDLFRQALDVARRQETLSWELRAATSRARLLRDQHRSADAIACLQPTYNRFTEGFGTADLIAARQLLDELSGTERESIPNDSGR